MIKTKNLSYKIAEKTILQNINLEINCGEITTILGANGAGKSTLLKILSGTIDASESEISFDDKKISDYSLRELAKKRAVLSQSNEVTFPFKVSEIVLMGRNPYSDKFEKNDIKICEEALILTDCFHLKDRTFFTLSGGEKQRVHLARVLAQIWQKENSYLFLDEPTSALDLKHQFELLEIAKKLVKEYKIAVIAILHDVNLAASFSDKIILLKQGKSFACGVTENILTPENLEHIFEIKMNKISYQGKSYFLAE